MGAGYGLLIKASYGEKTGPLLQYVLTQTPLSNVIAGFQDRAIELTNNNPMLVDALEARLQGAEKQQYFQERNFEPNFTAAYNGLSNPHEHVSPRSSLLYRLGGNLRDLQLRILGLQPQEEAAPAYSV